MFDEVGTVGAGGNSGFQALNLAAQFGAKRILLVGFDASVRGGQHWYGRNNWNGANNPDENLCDRWRKAFDGAAIDLANRGIEVINTALWSQLNRFKKMSIEHALQAWQLNDAA
jgi:hypothetical protein